MSFFLLSAERSFPPLRVLGIYVPYEEVGGGVLAAVLGEKQTEVAERPLFRTGHAPFNPSSSGYAGGLITLRCLAGLMMADNNPGFHPV